ncbi:gluconate 2-dehydrogenase subunit 3 family protein [Thalassotalea ponticola]|uniref:gluconate 2-dehydrogenase subunit 3 family protein n=1 Tax=Thalassotalea ponticola TaxID=1523392 RepID=UPI0025B458E5|nr:gluconate 2-dehydrogenase subunit 3 family protein [Thalassotalea ponticola]MDN3652306.1 gluconate 2-dehydrogenase subunit 3 family protein [Thalassotalea ponticola]
MNSFFEQHYQTPAAIKKRISRRAFLKSAAMTAAAAGAASATRLSWAQDHVSHVDFTAEPWRTLDQVMQHLLPSSASGPGAKEFHAINYLYLLLTEQPIDDAEKQFVKKGVGWLNGYTNKHFNSEFYQLSTSDKQQALTAISKSRAGENWLSTLITYIFEAMLAPSAYGGNPNGIGWQWLQHKPGFPMPTNGKRYFELDAYGRIDIKQQPDADKDNKAR